MALLLAGCGAALAVPSPGLATIDPHVGVSVSEIVERNAAARGGAQAWHRIETMAWTGYAENSGVPGRKVAFMLEQKRPGKVRFEVLEASGMKSVRAYDGANGWKMRADGPGLPQVTPYSGDELGFARGAQVIDGPLMDYVRKGAALSVLGIDRVDGRPAYVVDARLPSGGLHRVWIDADSFLELRHDREYNDASGRIAVATVRFREYHSFEGLLIPLTIESGNGAGRPVNRLVIERVALNPRLEDAVFDRPEVVPTRRGRITVDTRSAAMPSPSSNASRP